MANIDDLTIQITASTSQATKAISNLQSALSRLNSSLSSLKIGSQSVQNLDALAIGLDHVAKSANGIDAKKIKDISSAISSLSKVGKKLSLGTNIGNDVDDAQKKLSSLKGATIGDQSGIKDLANVNTNSITAIAQALEQIKSVGDIPTFTGVVNLSKNLKTLTTADGDALAKNLPLIANGLKSFNSLTIPTFSNLSEFAKGLKELNAMGKEDASKASQILPRISEGLASFRGIEIPNFENFDPFIKGISELRKMGTEGADKASQILPRIADGLRVFSSINIPNFENLGGLSKFAKALGNLANSNLDVAIQNLPRLATAFNQLVGSLNQGGIEKQTSALASSMANLVRALSGENFNQAVTRMPQLATAFNELVNSINQGNIDQKTADFATAMATLARNSGEASRQIQSVHKQTLNWTNLINMAEAKVAQFAKFVGKSLLVPLKAVGSAFVTFGRKAGEFALKFSGIKKEVDTTSNSFTKLAQTIGKFYASAFIVIRAIRGLGKSIKSSMDYIETLNYFKASFKQVSSSAVGNWSKLGYESAEAYANSFEQRAKQLTSKMTGFTVEDSGVLSMTGGKTLGLNPNTLMNYQAQFAQMASSMGMSANNATLVSQALTEIGADLASVKNMKFEDVWGDMASGLVGMSRTLDKYGVNIRKTALNQKLLDLGLDTTVDKLSGADKALLRVIVLLDSSRFAWSDLAKTINQPSNQLRLLTANLQNCARMLGNIFLPIVAKVLPYLNAMAIALERLLTYIAKLLGVDLSKVTGGVGGSNEAISDLLDDAEGLDDALDDASDSAKKLKNNLLGVDELNIVSDNITSADANGNMSSLLDDAFLDALSEYQKAWDEAFDNMENRANELADKIVRWFKDLFKPILKAWEEVGDKVKKAWGDAFESLGKLFKSIFSDVWDVWQNDLNVEIFKNLFEIIANIGTVVSNLAENFRQAWEEGGKGKSILESLQRIFWALTENAKEFTETLIEWSADLDFNPLLESIDGLLDALADNSYDIFGIWKDWYELVILPLGKYLIETFFPSIGRSLENMVRLIDFPKLREDLDKIFIALEGIAELVGGVFLKAFEKITTLIGENLNPFIERLSESFEKLHENLKNAKDINDVINAIFDFGDDRAVDLGSFVKSIAESISKAVDSIDFKNLGGRISGLFNNFLESADPDTIAHTIGGIINAVFDTILGFLQKLDWKQIGELIGKLLKEIDWTKVLSIAWEALKGLGEALINAFKEAPLEMGIITAIIGALASNKISKALTGKGILQNIFEAITGIDGESSAFGKLAKMAGLASGAKDDFTGSNKLLRKGTTDSIKKLLQEGDTFGKVAEGATEGASILELLGWGSLAVGGLATYFYGIWDAIKEGLNWLNGMLITGGATLAGAGIGGLIGALGGPIGAGVGALIGLAVGLITDGIIAIVQHWDEIKEWFGDVWQWLSDNVGQPIVDFFTNDFPKALDSLGETLSNAWTSISDWWSSTWETLSGWNQTILDTIGGWFTSLGKAIGDFVSNSYRDITGWVKDTWDAISGWFNDVKGGFEDTALAIKTWVQERIGEFDEWKNNLISNAEAVRDSIISTIETWVGNTVKTLQTWYTNATNAIKDWFDETKGKFDTWKTEVEGVVDGWRTAIEDKFNTWKQNVADIVEKWKGDIHDKFNQFISDAEAIFTGLKDKLVPFIEEFTKSAKETIEDFKEKAGNWIKEFANNAKTHFQEFYNKGKECVLNFIESAKRKFEELHTKIAGVLANIKTTAETGFKNIQKTASEWFTKAKWKFDGIREGLEEAFSTAWEKAKEIWEKIKEWLSNLSLGEMVEDVVDWGKGVAEKAGEGFKNLAQKASNALGDMFGKSSSSSSKSTSQRMSENAEKLKQMQEELNKRKRGFATGGFPEDGWFRASHGEIMGTFDNGQSVVANNQQITEGISRAVYDAIVSAGMGSGREEALLEELIQAVKNGQHITIDGREIVDAYDARKARNGYAF